jgi:hypothetical protein
MYIKKKLIKFCLIRREACDIDVHQKNNNLHPCSPSLPCGPLLPSSNELVNKFDLEHSWRSTSRSSMASLRWSGRRRWSPRRSEMPHARSWCVFVGSWRVCDVSYRYSQQNATHPRARAHTHVMQCWCRAEARKCCRRSQTRAAISNINSTAKRAWDRFNTSCQNLQQVWLMHDYVHEFIGEGVSAKLNWQTSAQTGAKWLW